MEMRQGHDKIPGRPRLALLRQRPRVQSTEVAIEGKSSLAFKFQRMICGMGMFRSFCQTYSED